MNRRSAATIAALLALSVAGCGSAEVPVPLQSKWPKSLVPPAGSLATAYADCLKQNNVTIAEIVGVWMVVRDTSREVKDKALAACRDHGRELEKSVGIDNGTKAPDAAGQTIVLRMYWCMQYYADIELPRDSLIFDASADPAVTGQWNSCLDLARNYTPNSDPPSTFDPQKRRSPMPDSTEPRVEQTW